MRFSLQSGRHTVPPVLSFTVLTEIATLLHLDKFHFLEPLIWAGLAAWVWTAIYTLVPITMIALLAAQLRAPGVDPPRTAPMPTATVAVLAVQAAILLPVGALLFLNPARWSSLWPWELTPLTSRAVGAWLLGIGIGLVSVVAERDLVRIRPGLIAYVALGTMQLIALARYGGDVRWGEPQSWIYVVVVTSIAAVGYVGLGVTRDARTKAAPR